VVGPRGGLVVVGAGLQTACRSSSALANTLPVSAADRDMVAQAQLLRATALLELGEPEGPAELAAYSQAAEKLGTPVAGGGAVASRHPRGT
jgi:hypothetical protein